MEWAANACHLACAGRSRFGKQDNSTCTIQDVTVNEAYCSATILPLSSQHCFEDTKNAKIRRRRFSRWQNRNSYNPKSKPTPQNKRPMTNHLNLDETIEIDPKVDFACKMLLGNEQYTHLTVHFLNAVLKPLIRIKSALIKNPISDKEYEEDKFSVFDVLATDENGWIYDIEIQRFLQTHLANRVTYYGSLKIVNQLKEGHGYGGLRPVVVICILDAAMLPKNLPYHNEFRLRTAAGHELTKLYQINILELPKFAPSSDNGLIGEPLEQWLYFFRRAHGSTPRELLKRLTDPIF